MFDPNEGAPKPAMPDTLCLLLDKDTRGGCVVWRSAGLLPGLWGPRKGVESGKEGGVFPPLEEARVDEESAFAPEVRLVELTFSSVLKLALERRRKSFKKEGAIVLTARGC